VAWWRQSQIAQSSLSWSSVLRPRCRQRHVRFSAEGDHPFQSSSTDDPGQKGPDSNHGHGPRKANVHHQKLNKLLWTNAKHQSNSGKDNRPEIFFPENGTSHSGDYGNLMGAKQQVFMFLGEQNTDSRTFFNAEEDSNSIDKTEEDIRWVEKVFSQRKEEELRKEVATTLINFYAAFTMKNQTAMEELWLQDETVQCTNPGQKPVVGYGPVMDTWRMMFASKDPSFRRNRILPEDPIVWVTGTTAVTFCYELVKLPTIGLSTPPQQRKMVALNILQKRKGKWYIVHHQSSKLATAHGNKASLQNTNSFPMPSPSPLPPPGSIPLNPNNNNGMQLPGMNGANPMQGFAMGRLGGPMSVDEIIELMGRVVKESEDATLEPTDEELSHLQHPPGFPGRDGHLHISPIGWVHLPGDSSSADSGMHITPVRKSAPSNEPGHAGADKPPRHPAREKILKDTNRSKKTIIAIRRITAEGRITDEAKQILLTEVIRCSASDELSPVEVAYELLLEQGPKQEARGFEEAIEDFADQCQLISSMLKRLI